jgi:2-(1,2-epoxy-1,2-dihydrophenyl)acetyl-CoA isomerase
MSRAMVDALASQLAWSEIELSVKCVVLTGAGKGFCAGGDVKGMAARGDGTVGDNTLDDAIHLQRVKQRATAGKLFKMPKPTIASLPGAAAGAGLSMALACDLRIMARAAILTTAFARVGFSGDYGGTYFLTQLVGSAKARELYYLSDRVGAVKRYVSDSPTGSASPTSSPARRERSRGAWRKARLSPIAT